MLINEKDVVKNVNTATIDRPPAGAVAAASAGLQACFLAFSLAFLTVAPAAAQARQVSGPGATVLLSALSPQAQHTQQLILAGGPFPYPKDGVVFGNYEKRLERQPRGYYHEYTVPTPGAHTRGARRIICGGDKPTEPDACFYTEDHYKSFRRIVN